jgi:hypothetical protein
MRVESSTMRIGSLAMFAVVAALVAPARAQPAGAQAEVMFRNAKRLLAQGKIAEACAAFDASQKLEPTVSTLLNQANCREKNGQLATAWGLFLDAERDTRASADDDGKQLHQVAVDHATKLEARLSTLTIVVPADRRASGLEIRRGNDLIDPVMWNQALPIDGGTYKIVARAPGVPEWSTSIAVANEGDSKSIEVALAAAEPAAARPPEPAKPPESKPLESARSPDAVPAKARTEPAKPRPAPTRTELTKAPAPAAEPVEALRLPGDGKTPWYCTESHKVSVGTCRPERERCEEFRAKMLAQVRDLAPCRTANAVVCFGLGGAPHCAPTESICDALRGSVQDRATSCQTKQVAPEPPRPPMWWCTDSRRADVGICKPQRSECDAFRESLIARQPDLATCRVTETAMCFEIAGAPYCAPSREVCDALRTRAIARPGTKATACRSRHVLPDPADDAPAKPSGPMWWCTDSRSSDTGICKLTRGDCEAFRDSLLGHRHDLSECHEVASAMCFEVGREAHCAPSRDVCEALRDASHQTAPCRAKAAPPSAKK